MERLLSEKIQSDIIDTLAECYPSPLTRAAYHKIFGDVPSEQMFKNVLQLIREGVIKRSAINEAYVNPRLNVNQLQLTEYGHAITCSPQA